MRRFAQLPRRPFAGSSLAVPAEAGPRAAAVCLRRHLHHQQRQQPQQHIGHPVKTACVVPRQSSSSRLFSTAVPRSQAKTEDTTTAEEKDALALAEEETETAGYQTAVYDTPQLVLPGPYGTAPRPEEVADVGYVPAETGDGLEAVGGLADWWEDDGHWDDAAAAAAVRGFGPARRETDAAVLEVQAQRAVLEAVAVRQAGSVSITGAWRRGGPAAAAAALGLQVDVDDAGRVVRVQGDVAGVVGGLATDTTVEEETPLGADEARAFLASSLSTWKDISLADPALKFAVTKRILQLTGHLLPDAQTAAAGTAGALLAVLVRPPRAARLAEELLGTDTELAGLPNVAVYGRRVTPIDKHKMAGRWKVIVQELEQRGLPVTGMGGHAKAVERKWASR